jgi:Fe2+ or Zn2+ uptake regulation protein
MADRFADVMQKERERLHREREQVSNQQQELEDKLAQIDRELEAIDAYEAAKSGKAKTSKRSAPARGPARARRAQARRGSRREALLQVIRENPDGLRRGEILERMGLKGDKAGEMSVSNVLTALTKSNQVSRHEGKYFAQGG